MVVNDMVMCIVKNARSSTRARKAGTGKGKKKTRQKMQDVPRVDPIHAQEIYLKSEHLEELRKRGVVPFSFVQHAGEMVLIPAGCAHQVSFSRVSCTGH